MKEMKFVFNCSGKKIPIILGRNNLGKIENYIRKLNPDKLLIVTDSKVKELYGQKLMKAVENFETEVIHFPAGEKQKNMQVLNYLLEEAVPHTTRDSCVVAFGGGVVGNMVGLLASMLYRSVRFIHVPTTLIAQLDSAISIKQAVNSRHGKNTFGSYYLPEFVYIDTAFLNTLGSRQIRTGLAEAIKHATSQSKKFYSFLFKILKPEIKLTQEQLFHVIKETINLRLKHLNNDPKENNPPFELGHRVGHSIERLLDGKWTHGESIALGMRIEAHLSHSLGYVEKDELEKIYGILNKAGLPAKIPSSLSPRQIVENIRMYDNTKLKKGPLFVLPAAIGKVKITTDVPLDMLEKSLREFC